MTTSAHISHGFLIYFSLYVKPVLSHLSCKVNPYFFLDFSPSAKLMLPFSIPDPQCAKESQISNSRLLYMVEYCPPQIHDLPRTTECDLIWSKGIADVISSDEAILE